MSSLSPTQRLERLRQILAVEIRDESLFISALAHKSAVNLPTSDAFEGSIPQELSHYERLEFLGDSVLNLAISDCLFEQFPHLNEGALSKLRATLVDEPSLAAIAMKLEIGELIFFSRGEKQSGGATKPSILADVVEALLGAVYLENGFDGAAALVERIFRDLLDSLPINFKRSDHKTELQEWTQAHFKETPTYEVEQSLGPKHELTFKVAVSFRDKVLGRGEGSTKKRASQKAACEALKKVHMQPDILGQLKEEHAND